VRISIGEDQLVDKARSNDDRKAIVPDGC